MASIASWSKASSHSIGRVDALMQKTLWAISSSANTPSSALGSVFSEDAVQRRWRSCLQGQRSTLQINSISSTIWEIRCWPRSIEGSFSPTLTGTLWDIKRSLLFLIHTHAIWAIRAQTTHTLITLWSLTITNSFCREHTDTKSSKRTTRSRWLWNQRDRRINGAKRKHKDR